MELLVKNKKVKIHLIKYVNTRNIILPRKKMIMFLMLRIIEFFITDFIDSELNNILYLDADVICIKNIESDYKKYSKN